MSVLRSDRADRAARPLRTVLTDAASVTKATGSAVLSVEHVTKRFPAPGGALTVVDDVSLSVGPGELVSIVGPSGCGKTTLLKMMQGLESPSAGAIAVRGGAPSETDVGFVFQQASLFPWWSVRKNVEFGLRLRARRAQFASRARRARVEDLLDLVGLGDFAEFLPSEISGGMQQRANLARALAIDPAVLLLDEPFSALDALTRERLQLVLDESLAALGTVAVLVSHDIREAVFLGTRVHIMGGHPGRILDTVEVNTIRPRGEAFQHGVELAEASRAIHDTMREHDPAT